MVSYAPKTNKVVLMFLTLHKDAEVEPNGTQKSKVIPDFSQGKCG